jgi:hypothetical protein
MRVSCWSQVVFNKTGWLSSDLKSASKCKSAQARVFLSGLIAAVMNLSGNIHLANSLRWSQQEAATTRGRGFQGNPASLFCLICGTLDQCDDLLKSGWINQSPRAAQATARLERLTPRLA